jgi:hypothetical protein
MTSETDTKRLIDRLAAELTDMRPLPSPHRRLFLWIAVSAPFAALVVLLMSPRPDLSARLADPRFMMETLAALATALAAAYVALRMVVPGSDRRLIWLPALPGAAWLATLGAGCLADWLRDGAAGLQITPDPVCLPKIALVGSVPALMMVLMLRRGAPLAPRGTLFLAGLGAAALGNFGLRFFHTQDAGLMVLIWQFGSVMLLATMTGLCGPRFLCWRHLKA